MTTLPQRMLQARPKAALLLVALAPLAASALPTCEELVGPLAAPLPPGVVSAQIVSAAAIPADTEPGHCDVLGYLDADASDPSVIGFRMKLPVPNAWNQKFTLLGGGGFEGTVDDFSRDPGSRGELGTPVLARGYAVGTTDTGHSAPSVLSGEWALNIPPHPGIHSEAEVNWAYRGTHLAALVEKAVIAAYYGRAPTRAYYLGQSNSGGTALKEAGLYPNDFDGIIAGQPVVSWASTLKSWTGIQQAQFPVGTTVPPVVSAAKFPFIQNAVLAKCDGLDGIVDGILDDPRLCDFDVDRDLPACPNDVDSLGCFTKTQRQVLKTIYQSGFEPSGEDVEWDLWLGAIDPALPNLSYPIAQDLIRYFIKDDAAFSLNNWLPNKADLALLSAADAPYNLDNFFQRGGKAIIWQGWIDPAVSPIATINYYQKVARGKDNNIRLYMVPSHAHGAFQAKFLNPADFLTALERWVERGIAPDWVKATSVDGAIIRPLCKYPLHARRIHPSRPDPDFANYACVK